MQPKLVGLSEHWWPSLHPVSEPDEQCHGDSTINIFTVVIIAIIVAFSALTLLDGRQEGHLAHKNMGGWWRWELVSPDGVVPSRMVCVSASVNLPLHHKVRKFSSGTGSPGWSRKKGRKMVVVVCGGYHCCYYGRKITYVFSWFGELRFRYYHK